MAQTPPNSDQPVSGTRSIIEAVATLAITAGLLLGIVSSGISWLGWSFDILWGSGLAKRTSLANSVYLGAFLLSVVISLWLTIKGRRMLGVLVAWLPCLYAVIQLVVKEGLPN